MRRIEFTAQARQDVAEVWEFIARDNLDAADRVMAAIEDATRLLAEHPGIGHSRHDVSDTRYRFWRVYSYLVAYRSTEIDLTVVRVVHGARDFRGLLSQ